MELTQYIRLFRKWLWLILIAAFVAGGISFIVNTSRPAEYEAATTISIGRYIEEANPNSADIRTGIDLAQTYAQLLRTFDVLQGTVDQLSLPFSADRLRNMISSRILTGTSLLVVTVTYTDPVMTADIANTLAEQLIVRSPTNLTAEQQAQIDFATTQIQELSAQVTDARLRLSLIDQQIAAANDAELSAQLTDQRNAVITQINEATSTIAQFSDTVTALQQRTNSLDIVERARIPSAPSGTNVLTTTLLGALIGASIAAGVALLIEYLDDTIRTTEDAAQTLALPVLGAVVRFGKTGDKYPNRLITNYPSMSPIAESYRTLRTNLLFSAQNSRKGVYVVTSAGPEEGKSITTANLAVAMAQAGLQVLLIDADLRRPRVHEIFGLENNVGLTTLLFADPGAAEQASLAQNFDESHMPANLKQCLQNTDVPRLRVITSGFIPSNPTEILGSALMQRWIETFRSSSNIDVVLFDTPPALVVADSPVLAATSKAHVVLVIDAGRTRRAAALKAKDQFNQLGVAIKGVVVNRVNLRDESYGYGYGYGYYYASPDGSNGAHEQPKKGMLNRQR